MALEFPSIMNMVLDPRRNSSLLRISSESMDSFTGSSNESAWEYAESPAIPSEIFWGSSCYLILVGSFGIASNLTVLIVFLTHKKLQTPFNLVLMNLIVAELLISLIGIPIDLTASLLQGWKLGYHLCLVTGFSMTLLESGKIWEGPRKALVSPGVLISTPVLRLLQFNALLIPKFWRNVSSDDGSHTTNHHPIKPPHIKNRFTAPAPLIGSLSGQTYDMSSKDKPRPDSHNTQPLDQPNSEQIGSIRITFTQPWRDGSKLADMDSTEAVYGDESAYRNKTTIARIQYTSNFKDFKEDTRF